MRKIVTLLFLGFLLVSCTTNDDDLSLDANAEILIEEAENSTTVLFSGDFVSAAHPTSGMATVSSDGSTLNFTNFKTDDGPKLLVYLSTDPNASEFVDLGDLKGIEGDYSYAIPEGTDIVKYKFVNIWCVDFSVGFGHAELKN
ncbi:DM13 domain-containing protein [Lutibacter holmesii]|uniref:DM13 domain-containing protein n=1 Tax=Lutibacter holmesii TaxID=1137985 RepID=A0ABW3WJK2_9FLAO